MALVGLAGTVLGIAAVSIHLAAGLGVPSDVARALSVQLPITGVGLVLTAHRPRNRLGPLALTAGALLGLSLLAVGILRYAALGRAVPDPVVHAAFAAVVLLGWPLTVVWLLALLSFPDGTPPTRIERPWLLAAVGTHAVAAVGAFLTASRADLPEYLLDINVPVGGGPFPSDVAHAVLAALDNVFLLALPGVGVVALILRRRRLGPTSRQQLKWLLPALGLQLLLHLAVRTIADPWHGGRAVAELVVLAAPTLGAAAIGVAVFKYRLWEMDAVISKALVFALLSALTTVVFVVASFAVAAVAGRGNPQVLSAMVVGLVAIAVSHGPRRWSGRAVRRIVYGERPTGFSVLEGLGASLASTDATTDVADRIVDAVRRGLSTPWAAVWLHVESDGQASLQPVAAGGVDARPLLLPPTAAGALVGASRAGHLEQFGETGTVLRPLFGDEPVALAPLVAGPVLVGLVACGDRFREPFEEGDFELLSLVARDAALGLANRRLETELRLRVAELRRSRQRLVTAQDAERRRVERDLHDGVQAQLVGLASRLRRLASTPADATAASLGALAVEAEDSLFALQDLARGIYPSVLTDRGLPAAIRAQAARMPVDVEVSVDAALTDVRLPADVEAALYFVALEALGNAQKHAVDVRVRAGLRLDLDVSALLEVSDDGPGFDTTIRSRPGSGLVNMSDRMNAIGGTLVVRSELGHGSCVSATAPLPPGWRPDR